MHVAIIMDGNGRWAHTHRLPRSAGYHAGAAAVRRVTEAAPALGIEVLTLYAFSADDWRRPRPHARARMRALSGYLGTELAAWIRQGVRVEVLGLRERLPARVRAAIELAERRTAAGTMLRLRLALDDSALDAIVLAAQHVAHGTALARGRPAPDIDLLIRTGGGQRLGDFLLWGSARARLYFTELAWPDFDRGALLAALASCGSGQRKATELL
jgi:undecaprenyl diphosphate synthase